MQVFNSTGELINFWGYEFDNGPTILTRDDEGYFYVGSENYVLKYTTDGNYTAGLILPSDAPTMGDYYAVEYNPVDQNIYLLYSLGGAADQIYVYNTAGDYLYNIVSGVNWGHDISQ